MAAPLVDEARDLLLDSDNDFVIENGDLVFARGVTAIAQDCRIALRTMLGEWFRDRNQGIPFYQAIFSTKPGGPGIVAARISMRSALLAVEGVTGIAQFDVNLDSKRRTLSVKFIVRTATGNTPLVTVNAIVGGQ